MDRSDQYKHKAENIDEMRAKRRQEQTELRKCRRERLLNTKRVRLEDIAAEEDDELTGEQVRVASENLVAKSGDRRMTLQLLRRGFTQGTALVDVFLGVDNALHSLVGILTGTDAELQLDAAWCLTNMAAGTHDHASAILKSAGPYLVMYLEGGSTLMQDQCAWALGNIAGDCEHCRDTLLAQGVLPPLMKLIQSTYHNVIRSAAFALCNLARGDNPQTKLLVDEGIIPLLLRHLVWDSETVDCIAEVAWVLTYLAAGGSHEDDLASNGSLEKIAKLIVDIAANDPNNYTVLTPTLRCLGNLCSGPEALSARVCENSAVIPALGKFICSDHRHIRKESLWALSNMTGYVGVCEAIISHNLLPAMIELLSSTYDIKQEAAYCICNLASHGPTFCHMLYDCGALQAMTPLLKSSELENIRLALCFVEMVLRNTQKGVKSFEELGGLDCLELLEYHANEDLRGRTNDILDTYYYKEDDEDSGSEIDKPSNGDPMLMDSEITISEPILL